MKALSTQLLSVGGNGELQAFKNKHFLPSKAEPAQPRSHLLLLLFEVELGVSSCATNAFSYCQLSNTNIILYNGARCAALRDQQGCNLCLKGFTISSIFAQ